MQNNQEDDLPTYNFFQEQEQVSLQGSLLCDKYEGNAFIYFYYDGEEGLYLRTSDGTNEYMYWCDADGIPSRQEQYPFGEPSDLRFPSEPDWELDRDTSTLYRYADGTLENTIVISGDRYQSDPICLFQEGPRVLYSEGENRQMITVRELSEEVLRLVDLEELGYGDYRLVSIQPYDKKTAQLNLLTKEAKVFILLLDLDTMELVSPAFTQVETEQGKFLLSPYSLEAGGTVYPYQENTDSYQNGPGCSAQTENTCWYTPETTRTLLFSIA